MNELEQIEAALADKCNLCAEGSITGHDGVSRLCWSCRGSGLQRDARSIEELHDIAQSTYNQILSNRNAARKKR